MKLNLNLMLAALLFGALSLQAQDRVIEIRKPTTRLIPVSITGLTGEAADVLKFDLSVLGIEVADSPEYIINGSDNGRVEGSLTPSGASHPLWLRAYAGGSVRAQAHAFADDIAKELRQTTPIFRTKVAFRLSRAGATEVCVSDYDGYGMIVLTHDATLVSSPSWIPGGHSLLYTSWMNNKTEIYEHNLATGARRVFAGYPGASFSAEVAPDGRRVAMILSKSGSPNLYVCNLDGSGLKELTFTRDDDSSPCWAPDSREICFVCRSGRAMLQKISADGGAAVTVHAGGAYGNLTSPDWSPDGSQIAFTSGSRPFHIWVMPASGGEAKMVADGEDPCWAPNSRTLIFTQQGNDKQVLSLLDVPTKHVKTVRQISGSCSEPSWAR
jgi:TolB protein